MAMTGLTSQDVPPKQKPSDLDATPQATEEHERLLAAYDHVCKEKSRLTILKKKAKEKQPKQIFAQQIGDLELAHHLLSKENPNSIAGSKRRSTPHCMESLSPNSMKELTYRLLDCGKGLS